MIKIKFINIYLIFSLFLFANCSDNNTDSGSNEETIKIAHIDPQTGPFALQGASGTSHMRYIIEKINADGGVLGGRKLEIVALDNKTNPQESLVNLEQAIGEGIQYITQGNGSHVGRALTEAVKKHNEALEIVNTEKEKAFGFQKQLELLNEMKAEENPEAVIISTIQN